MATRKNRPAAVDGLQRRALERPRETSLDAAVDRMRFHLVRSGRVDVHSAVHRHGLHLAVHAVGGDSAVDRSEVERHRCRYAKVIVDSRLIAEAEETEMMFVPPADDQRVAT